MHFNSVNSKAQNRAVMLTHRNEFTAKSTKGTYLPSNEIIPYSLLNAIVGEHIAHIVINNRAVELQYY